MNVMALMAWLSAFKQHITQIFEEKISGKNTNRPQLQSMLDYTHDNDEVFVMSLDRSGRSNEDLTNIIETIRPKGVVLNVIDLPRFEGVHDKNLQWLLTNLVFEVQKYSAENERKEIKTRQRQGIQSAKAKGLYRGEPVEYSPDSGSLQKRLVFNQIIGMLKDRQNGKKYQCLILQEQRVCPGQPFISYNEIIFQTYKKGVCILNSMQTPFEFSS